MKKTIAFSIIAGTFLLAAQAQAAVILNDDAADQNVIAFTPSTSVTIVYEAGSNGVPVAKNTDEPQQYYSVSKHEGGTRVFVTTESANISFVEDDDWRGQILTTAGTGGLDPAIPDVSGYLGENIEVLNADGWTPL